MKAGTLILALSAGLAVAMLAGTASARPAPPPEPPPDIPNELGPLYAELPVDPFSLPKTSAQRERLERLASRAEAVSGIAGLRDYLVATAWTESKFYTTAINATTDALPALRLLCKYEQNRKRFASNPWAPSMVSRAACEGDPRAPRWRYSGGWFGLMPVVALASSSSAYQMDPARVFDPAFAVAFATQHVRNLARNYGAKDYAGIRAGWGLPSWAGPGIQSEGEAKNLEHFMEAIKATGVRPNLATTAIQVPKDYPGLLPILLAVLAEDGRELQTDLELETEGPQA